MARLTLSQSPTLRQEQRLSMPSAAAMATITLTHEQVLALLKEVIEDGFPQSGSGNNGNYLFSKDFRNRVKCARKNIVDCSPEFAISTDVSDVSIEFLASESRRKIDEVLGEFSGSSNFVRRFIEELDWATDVKRKTITHLSSVQAEYISNYDDKFLLAPQTQNDVGDGVGVSATTICHLLKQFTVLFPDKSVHPVRSLVPGHQINRIKGEHALSILRDDPALYDSELGWKKSGKYLAKEIEARFGLKFADRTVRKYMLSLGYSRAFGAKKREFIHRADSVIAQYTQRPELFDAERKEWRLSIEEIRRLIRDEAGISIPKEWIEALKFETYKFRLAFVVKEKND